MRVLLEDSLFDGRNSPLDLIEVLSFALSGRHIVLIEPDLGSDDDTHANRWLEQRGAREREELKFALESSIEEEARRDRGMRTICVGNGLQVSDPRTTSYSLANALALLRRPLKILVENAHNDGAFIRRMLPPSWRKRFKRFEDEFWAVFENGGGLGTLKVTLRNLNTQYATRTVTVFDSDAKQPNEPSSDSNLVLRECAKLSIERVQLKRRAAENYLPLESLRLWSEKNEEHKPCARAFARLSQSQRHHYSMRDGFKKDFGDESPLPKLFEDVTNKDRTSLRRGFGDIRSLYISDEIFQEHFFERDDVHGERETLRALIFNNL